MTMNILEELGEFFHSLGDRKDLAIAARRVLALEDRTTLDILGQDFGFSREAVRQRETKVERRIAARRSALSKTLSAAVCEFAAQVRDGLDLNDAHRSLPACLIEGEESQSVALRRLFLYLAGPYEIWHGLLLRADLTKKAGSLRQKLWNSLQSERVLTIDTADQYANRFGIKSPDVINKILESVELEHNHVYTIPGGTYIYEPKAADRAVRALREQASPLTSAELAQTCGVSQGTLLNAVGNDDRIIRLDRDRYGLAQWSFCEYDGIVGSIHKALEVLGDMTPLDKVAEWVTEQFDVEWSSVISNATRHYDFVTSDGKVRRRRNDEELDQISSHELGEVGDCLYIDGHLALRVVIDANLWRGSGQPVPRSWANKASVTPGHKMNIGTGQDSVTVSWVGSEPTLGSLRALASKNSWPQEGIGFLILDGSKLITTWRPLPPEPSEDAFKAAMAMDSLFALPTHPNGHPLDGAFWTTLGARLGLEPLHQVPGVILSRLGSRREKITDPYVDVLRKALLISESRGLVIQIDI